MENWGLITFRATRLLYQPGVSSESNKQSVATIISHELAHQWFGNLVTPKWWNDLWLNEGFASYVEYLGVDHVYPDWEMMEQFLLLDLQLVFPLDSLATSHPISVEVDHPKKIKQIFDRISYSKGSSIIRMLSGFLGQDQFTKGLQYYLQTYAFKDAEMKDLWNALGSVSKTDVKTVMDTWTLQMGYPVVTVAKKGNKATVTQKHFLADPTSNVTEKSPFDYKWYVPFTFFTDKVKSTMIWMNKTSAEFTWPDGTWIKGNYKQIGYYRVNYDEANWQKLSKQLQVNHKVRNDYYIMLYKRATFLRAACANGDKQANKNATDIFFEWKNGKRKHIDVDLRSLVYRYGIANTGEEEWQWMFNKFLNTSDVTEKNTLMSALGSSNKPWILNKFLASSLDPKLIRAQDMVSVIRYVAYNPVGKYLAWNFAQEHWGILLDTFGTVTFRMTSLMNGITHAFNTEFDLKQMQHFFDTSEAGTSEVARKQAIERTKTKIAWLKNNEAEVEEWLKKNI
ncbi:Aminopeptidase N [Exaiptasia diaphana]|nr:Aminopeptidase N [Exaiptasia diaphana]